MLEAALLIFEYCRFFVFAVTLQKISKGNGL